MSSDSAGIPKCESLRRFFEAIGLPALGNALDLFGEFEIDVPHRGGRRFVVEFAGADVFVAEIGVGNLRWSSE